LILLLTNEKTFIDLQRNFMKNFTESYRFLYQSPILNWWWWSVL